MVSSGVGAMMAGSRLVVMMVQREFTGAEARKEQEEVVGEVRDNWGKGKSCRRR